MNATSIVMRTPVARLIASLTERLAQCLGRTFPACARDMVADHSNVVEFEVPNRAERIAEVRSRVVDFARKMPFSEEAIQDIRLAVCEAATNALRHGAGDGSCQIVVRMQRLPDGLSVTVSDRGCGFDPDSVPFRGPEWLGEGGRGIWFMRAVMDEVTFRSNHPGTSVELVKRFPVKVMPS